MNGGHPAGGGRTDAGRAVDRRAVPDANRRSAAPGGCAAPTAAGGAGQPAAHADDGETGGREHPDPDDGRAAARRGRAG